MVKHLHLTQDEQAETIPSGGVTKVAHRTGWAMTYLTKAGLIKKHEDKAYRATDLGKAWLKEYPTLTVKHLRKADGWEAAWHVNPSENVEAVSSEIQTPTEALDAAFQTLQSETRQKLLDAILQRSPEFFERLVLDVLIKMGYGGSHSEAARHMGRSGDEGIDGCINQDALGLDQIFVQAKRYAPERAIDRPTIQAFIGALTGHGVTKGIFITTSRFVATAEEFVRRGAQTKIVLIDGAMLIDFMLAHHIGIRVERTLEVTNLDQNYFAEDE